MILIRLHPSVVADAPGGTRCGGGIAFMASVFSLFILLAQRDT